MRKHQGEGRRLEETADRKTKITQNKSAIKEERGIKDETNAAQSSCRRFSLVSQTHLSPGPLKMLQTDQGP